MGTRGSVGEGGGRGRPGRLRLSPCRRAPLPLHQRSAAARASPCGQTRGAPAAACARRTPRRRPTAPALPHARALGPAPLVAPRNPSPHASSPAGGGGARAAKAPDTDKLLRMRPTTHTTLHLFRRAGACHLGTARADPRSHPRCLLAHATPPPLTDIHKRRRRPPAARAPTSNLEIEKRLRRPARPARSPRDPHQAL